MWLTLLIIGIVLLLLGQFLPVPYPGKQLLVAGGVICAVVALILLLLGFVHADPYRDRAPVAAAATLVV